MPGSSKKQTIYLSDIPKTLVKAIQQAQRIFGRSGYEPKKDEDDAFSYFWSQTLPQCVPQRARSVSLMSPEISRRRSLSSVSISTSIVSPSPKRPLEVQTVAGGNNQVMFALAYMVRLKKNQITLDETSFKTYLNQHFGHDAFADDVTEIVAFYQQLLEVLSSHELSSEFMSKFSATTVDARTRKQFSEISDLADINKSKKCKTQQDIVRLLVEAIRADDLASTLSSDRGHPSFSASSPSIPSSKPKPSRSGFFSCCCSADDSDDEKQSERLLTVTAYNSHSIN